MLSIKRGSHGRSDDGRRRSGGALALSVAVNVAVLALFLAAAATRRDWVGLFRSTHQREVMPERIGFLVLPKTQPADVAGRSGGDGQPVSRAGARSATPLVAPTAIPENVPAAGASTSAPTAGGTGPVIGSGGPAQGIRPSYSDPRLWGRPGSQVTTAPKSAKERIDSVIADRFGAARDSMVAAQEIAAGQRKPGDWTVQGPGGKWGMDQQSIHLGKISIPNAVLALLSSNLQKNLRGNPIEMDNERRLAQIRQDLMQHAQREMSEDDFRKAVREIRQRKDRERAAKVTAQTPASGASEPAAAQPAGSGGQPR